MNEELIFTTTLTNLQQTSTIRQNFRCTLFSTKATLIHLKPDLSLLEET